MFFTLYFQNTQYTLNPIAFQTHIKITHCFFLAHFSKGHWKLNNNDINNKVEIYFSRILYSLLKYIRKQNRIRHIFVGISVYEIKLKNKTKLTNKRIHKKV